jgi:hypothetical protein
MSKTTAVALKCNLSKGIFSTERIFEMRLANGETFTGLSPVHFCWNDKGDLLRPGEGEGEAIPGFIAARVVEELEGDQVAVEVPSGDVLAVRKAQIRERPTPITPPRTTASA